MSDNVDAIKAAHEAFLRADIEALAGFFDENITLTVPESLPYGGTFTGRVDVAGFFALLSEYFDELELHPQELLEAADRVVDIGKMRGRGKGDGGEFEIRYCIVWKMRGGKAAAMEEFSDTATLKAVAEGQPATYERSETDR
jgi:ketosteroid isomerase-like protein